MLISIKKVDVLISDSADIAKAKRNNFRNSAGADEEKTLKELVIRDFKPNKYYKDRKGLTQWLL